MRSHEVLEVKWAEWNRLDPKGMVVCSSGTAALHLTMEVLRATRTIYGDESTHDEVILNDFSMIACPRAVALAGLKPVFVDCNNRLLMDHKALIDAKGRRSRAVLAVHNYGRREDTHFIHHVSESRGLLVIEDLAEAHWVTPHTDSFAACWSFYANKIVAGEEGGAVWFRDPKDAGIARRLRCLGFTECHDFTHIPRGHNYRLADTLANLILASLGKVWANLERRRENVMIYDRVCPKEWQMPEREVPWVYDIRLAGIGSRLQNEIVCNLREAGIEARHGFKPNHHQEEFVNCKMFRDGSGVLSASELASIEVIYLPCHPQVTTYCIDKAIEIIKREMKGVNPLK